MESFPELEDYKQNEGLSQAAKDRLKEIESSTTQKSGESEEEEEDEEDENYEFKSDDLLVSWFVW